jgi:hypothetical protein
MVRLVPRMKCPDRNLLEDEFANAHDALFAAERGNQGCDQAALGTRIAKAEVAIDDHLQDCETCGAKSASSSSSQHARTQSFRHRPISLTRGSEQV